MTDKAQSLVPGRLHLPTAIERRTRITNRLLGELTSRDTEAFFRRHLEFFRLVVSRYYPLNEDIIERFKDQLDWANLSANKALIWSEILLEKYQDNWDWESLSGNESLPWNRYLLENYQDYWDWQKLSQILPWDENLIACFADYWDWDILSERKDLPWSCYFICQFEGRWAWDLLTRNESLLWSEDLLDWFRDRWDWNWLSENKPLSLNQELLLRFYDYWNLETLSWNVFCLERDTEYWNWKSLSKKKNLPWNEAFIEQYQDYWDWDNLSRNEGLPWSESLIEKFIDHWNWNELSGNEVLPWSQKLIEKFKSRWNWELFSENKKLPWNMVWGKEYLERYKYVYDPEPLDFIERFIDESNHHWTSIQINDWFIEQNELYWQVWTNLSNNELLPWSHQLFDRYEDQWNIKSVASHYDGNVRSLTLEQVDRLILLASSEAVESPSQEQPSLQTPVHENPSLSQMPKAKGERLSSDLMFDEETYAKAKPLFEAGLAHFKDVAKDVREFMRLLIRELLDRFKDPSLVRNMKPYIVKFIEDQQNQQNQALEKIKVSLSDKGPFSVREERQDAKFGQVSAGIDPDIMSSGIQLAGFHLEAGVQKFVDFVKAITADLGVSLEQIKPYYLCGWYNGARDLMKDSGLSIDGMDDMDQVRKDMEKLVAADKASQADQSMHLPKTKELVSDEDLLSAREERPDVYDAAVREYLEDYAEKFGDR